MSETIEQRHKNIVLHLRGEPGAIDHSEAIALLDDLMTEREIVREQFADYDEMMRREKLRRSPEYQKSLPDINEVAGMLSSSMNELDTRVSKSGLVKLVRFLSGSLLSQAKGEQTFEPNTFSQEVLERIASRMPEPDEEWYDEISKALFTLSEEALHESRE